MSQNYVGNKDYLLRLHRIPRLRPPRMSGSTFVAIKSLNMHLVERFPQLIITPICFLTDVHGIPNILFHFGDGLPINVK